MKKQRLAYRQNILYKKTEVCFISLRFVFTQDFRYAVVYTLLLYILGDNYFFTVNVILLFLFFSVVPLLTHHVFLCRSPANILYKSFTIVHNFFCKLLVLFFYCIYLILRIYFNFNVQHHLYCLIVIIVIVILFLGLLLSTIHPPFRCHMNN